MTKMSPIFKEVIYFYFRYSWRMKNSLLTKEENKRIETDTTLAGFALSLMRHSAIDTLCSFRMTAALCRISAHFHN